MCERCSSSSRIGIVRLWAECEALYFSYDARENEFDDMIISDNYAIVSDICWRSFSTLFPTIIIFQTVG